MTPDPWDALGHDQRHVYRAAVALADSASGALPPSSVIAAEAGLSKGYARRLLAELDDGGWFRVIAAWPGKAIRRVVAVWRQLSTTRARGRGLDAVRTLPPLSPGARRKTSPWDRAARVIPRHRPRVMGQTWLNLPDRE